MKTMATRRIANTNIPQWNPACLKLSALTETFANELPPTVPRRRIQKGGCQPEERPAENPLLSIEEILSTGCRTTPGEVGCAAQTRTKSSKGWKGTIHVCFLLLTFITWVTTATQRVVGRNNYFRKTRSRKSDQFKNPLGTNQHKHTHGVWFQEDVEIGRVMRSNGPGLKRICLHGGV